MREPKAWITVNGKHIPIFDEEYDRSKDPYFKKDWEEGQGPKSKSFQNALAYAKKNVDKESYSFDETVEDAMYAYHLTEEEASVLGDRLKMYAMENYKYKDQHNKWKDDFEKRGISLEKKESSSSKEVKIPKSKWYTTEKRNDGNTVYSSTMEDSKASVLVYKIKDGYAIRVRDQFGDIDFSMRRKSIFDNEADAHKAAQTYLSNMERNRTKRR